LAYQPIENYGIIGSTHSVALVGMDDSIDWLCFPHFDSPSVFAAILDDRKGGRFKISPAPNGVTCRQMYWPDTNVLVTRFLSPDGVGEVTDYMTVGAPENGHGHQQLGLTLHLGSGRRLHTLRPLAHRVHRGGPHFMYWLEFRCWESKPEGPLQLMYGVDGRTDLTEETLDHLEGYKVSRPARSDPVPSH